MRDFEAVVFDMDGVIFDSERATLYCWLELAEKYGIENLEKTFYECIGTNKNKTKEIMLNAYEEDFPYDEFAHEASVMYHAKYDGGKLPLKPGVRELLQFLKEKGKRIAIASSTRRSTVVNEIKDAGLLEFFDVIICGDMVERSKPDPDIYLKACSELGVEPKVTYAIEDSFNGIRSAFEGELHPIMVPDMLLPDDEMKAKAETIETNLFDVLKYFEKIMNSNEHYYRTRFPIM